MSNADILEHIKTLDQEFIKLTGRQAFGYVSNPTPITPRLVFQDGTVCLNYPDGLNFMTRLVMIARQDPSKLPYPFDQELTTAQDLRVNPR